MCGVAGCRITFAANFIVRFYMLSTRKLVAAGAVFAVGASGLALAETVPGGPHQMGSDHQPITQGQHPMGPNHMRE
jgi:hypothetical protein